MLGLLITLVVLQAFSLLVLVAVNGNIAKLLNPRPVPHDPDAVWRFQGK